MTDPAPSSNGVMMYVRDGVNYQVRVGDLLSVAGVPTDRQVLAGTGLTGGGQLLNDVTLSVAPKAIGWSQLTDTGVTAGIYGSSGYTPVINVDSTGRVVSVSQAPITSESGGTVKSVDVSGGSTGLTTSGGPVTSTGTISLGGVLNVVNGGTGSSSAAGAPFALKGDNTDITSLAGITGGVGTADFIQFDTAVTPTPTVGKLGWDVNEHGLSVLMTGGNVNLQVGQETVLRVYNNTGSAMVDGQVVYCTGSQGQRLTVALALANSDLTSAAIIGMVTEPIPNNAEGFITVQGRVGSLNTVGFADGAVIYLSPAVAGAWTTTKPQAPQHNVMVGYVVKGGSAGAGSIYVHVQNGYELDELHDVKITSVANTELLQYDSAIPAWKNVNPSAVAVGSATTATTATNLAGGAASQIAYQTGAGATGFIPNGTSGQFLTSTGATAPTWSTAGALTKTDDTNVTLTLGGSATTALVNAASITVGWSGTLAATRGGTGTGTYAVGDILYASTTSALSRLADVATGNALISGGVGVAPSWGKVGLTTHVSGTLPIANGGTNSTATPTAGGSAYGTGSAVAYTAAGTAGQVLTSTGATAPVWGGISGGTF